MSAIENVSDTARWVAMYRAQETERADAHFRDPHARRLAGERGEAILREVPRAKQSAWAMIVRTQVLDENILDLVRGSGVDLVINLAAGLDARPWRLDLPSTLRWVDVDLPDITEHKAMVLAGETPRCRYEAVALDLRDGERRRALFTQLCGESARALAIAEGLLIYLEPEDVGSLAQDLASAGVRWWLIDLASPRFIRIMRKLWGKNLAFANAPFRFAPADGTAFFGRHGWSERRFFSLWDESKRLKREMQGAWLWRALTRLMPERRREEGRRFSGVVLLEKT